MDVDTGEANASLPEVAERRRVLMRELVMRLMLGRRAPVTLLLIGIMVFVFVLSVLLGGSTEPAVLEVLGAKVNELVNRGERWRLVSSVFVHVGPFHLLVNGYALYVLGRLAENGLGRRRFLILFVLAGLAGSVSSYLASPHPSAGASGAIFGLLGASLASGVKYRASIPGRLRRQLAMALIPWLVLTLLYGFSADNIDNAAHLGGLAAGMGYGLLVDAPLLAGGEAEPEASIVVNLALGAAMGLLLYGAVGTLASVLHSGIA